MKFKHPLWIVAVAAIVYLLAIPVDIMEVDSAQYANMSREMLQSGDFLNVFDRGREYLDKPPFIFWITACFYWVFGVGEFAFKLPAILFALLGIYSVYRFARIWYPERTAVLAAIILATSQGYYHFTNDVRTDVYLTNAVIAAIWLFSEQIRQNRGYYWVGAFFFVGIGMLAKGPLGIVVPVMAIGTHLLIKSEWSMIFKWQWLVGLIVVAIVLSPMLVGLYQQFDLQPDKMVNGRTGVSGIRFFFWEQSFGRITGENVWKNDTGPFFFVHSFAWSFLPWTLGFIGAMVFFIRNFGSGFKSLIHNQTEWISIGGFWLPFIALSASNYKLPHYIYVVFPMAAVQAASFFSLIELRDSKFNMRWINISQTVILSGCWGFGALIFIWFFPVTNPILILVGIAGLAVFIWSLFHVFEQRLSRFLWMSLSTTLAINILMATWFYPQILSYQSSSVIGKWILDQRMEKETLFVTKVNARSIDVYTHSTALEIATFQIDSILQKKPQFLVFTNEEGLTEIKDAKISYSIVRQLEDYPVALLSMNFGNPGKRKDVLRKTYLIRVKKTI
jgi:4-amino-4-deoxy-L-arabinose transferase-like glycosyltransferase